MSDANNAQIVNIDIVINIGVESKNFVTFFFHFESLCFISNSFVSVSDIVDGFIDIFVFS